MKSQKFEEKVWKDRTIKPTKTGLYLVYMGDDQFTLDWFLADKNMWNSILIDANIVSWTEIPPL